MLRLVHVSQLTRQRGAFLDLLPPNFAIQNHKLAAAAPQIAMLLPSGCMTVNSDANVPIPSVAQYETSDQTQAAV